VNPRATVVLLLIALGLGIWVWLLETGGPAPEEGAKLVPLELEDVTALDLPLKDGGRVRLVRGVEESWSIESPISYPADAGPVADLLRDVTGLESSTRLDNVDDDRARFGIGDPTKELRVEAGDEAIVLRWGRETPFGGDVYASVEGDDAIHTTPGWKLDQLSRELRTLRDPRMFELVADEVDYVRIELDGESLAQARRMDGSWVLVEPFAEPADEDTIGRLLEDLVLARATGFVDAPGPLSSYGLEPPQVVLEVGSGDAKQRLEMGGSDDKRYLRVDGTGQVYEIATRIADGVPRTIFRLRDRQVLKLDEGDIQSVTLIFPRDDLRHGFVRAAPGWKADGHEEAFDETRLEELVYALSDVDAVEIPAPDAEPGSLGLLPPRVRIELRGREGAELGWVEFGDVDPARGLGARSSQKDRLWLVDAELGAEVPLGATVYRETWLSGAGEDVE
jgi:hypothetical protein